MSRWTMPLVAAIALIACTTKFDKQDPTDGSVLERIEIPEPNPTPHGLTFWKGHFIYCDAAHGPIGPDRRADFVSYDRGQVWRINL